MYSLKILFWWVVLIPLIVVAGLLGGVVLAVSAPLIAIFMAPQIVVMKESGVFTFSFRKKD